MDGLLARSKKILRITASIRYTVRLAFPGSIPGLTTNK